MQVERQDTHTRLLDLPVEIIQKLARLLRPGDGTLHAASYAMSPLRALDKNRATERGNACILNLALVNKWLCTTLLPVYWEHPIQPAALDVHALKRLYQMQPSVLPFIQSLDLRDGQPKGDNIRRRSSTDNRDLRFAPICALSRVAKEMPNLRSMSLNAVSHLPIDYTCWPALTHLSLNFASYPNSESMATLLSFVPGLRSLEFGKAYGIRRTPQADKNENFGHELRVFGKALDDLPSSAWSMKPFAEPDPDAETGTEESDEDDEPTPIDRCILFDSIQKMPKLEHFILTSESYLRSAHWPMFWTSPPHLRALTLTLNATFDEISTVLLRFGDSIEQLQLAVSSHDSSWWSAHDRGLTLPECLALCNLEFVQYAGQRVAGPTLRIFREQKSLETVRILYRSGEQKQHAHAEVEESPDIEDLQHLAIDPDALPGLRRLVIRNIKPFRFSVPFEALFDYGQTEEEQMMGQQALTRDEIKQLYQQNLLQEGWPLIRCKKALRQGRDLDEARQWLIDNLETAGIDDNDEQETSVDSSQTTLRPTDDLQMALAMQEAERAAQQQQMYEARELARTSGIVDQLRLLFLAKEPSVELMCWPEGREADECD